MNKLVSYDAENDIFAIHKGFARDEKFKGNIDAGDLVLDVSTAGRIRGIEIINATKFLEEFKVEREQLEGIKNAEFNAKITPNSVILGLVLETESKQIPAKIAVPLPHSL